MDPIIGSESYYDYLTEDPAFPPLFEEIEELESSTSNSDRRSHKNLKPYNCDELCDSTFSRASHLQPHKDFHQNIKPYACTHEGCEAQTMKSDLKDHIRKTHTRERLFKCEVCSKSFLTSSVYRQHTLIHNDRRYECNVCEKTFSRSGALTRHHRIHTDERPHQCEVCGARFTQKCDLRRHVCSQHANFHVKFGNFIPNNFRNIPNLD